ncbi:hypothetical protein C8J56DRAFT_931793 [Mycena floridula]|nr:hypothetical protein C8J56DRAFT_931793 [Mycena floridula]
MALPLIKSFTLYNALLNAVQNDVKINSLVKHLAKSHQASLTILCGLFASVFLLFCFHPLSRLVTRFYVQTQQMSYLSWVIAAILLTISLSCMYDNVEVETFRMHVQAVGIFGFIIINSLPSLTISAFLFRELFTISTSIACTILQTGIVFTPFLIQLSANLLLILRRGRKKDNVMGKEMASMELDFSSPSGDCEMQCNNDADKQIDRDSKS